MYKNNQITSFKPLILFLFIFPFTLKGQILKIEKAGLDVDTAGVFKGNIGADFNINNRSATPEEDIIYRGLEANIDLSYLSAKHAYILLNKLNYFKITNGPLISTGYIHGRTNFLRKRKLSYELFSQLQYDDGRRMPFRYLLGGGLKLKILDGSKGSLFAGIGIMNEIEHWQPFGTENIVDKQIWKNTNYLSGDIQPSENFKINITSYYQGGYDDESDIFRSRISGDLQISAQITGKLAFTTNFILLYESDPIININPVVYSLTNGLKLNF
ncbi:MAG: DUF481 domain-containing protein [Candidatus Cyclobacteriaceae bacterium M2_1C_046]